MFLSKFIIDRHNPSARQALINVQDFHRNLMKRFQSSRQDAGVLYRLDLSKKDPIVYVLSKIEPQNTGQKDMHLKKSRQMDQIILSMINGKRFGFDILVIPSKKVVAEGKKNSRRITLTTELERLKWFQKKALQYGFQVLSIQELNEVNTYGRHGNNSMLLKGYHYQGQLLIEDEEKFRLAYCEGIGPDKAYGFGMLLLL